ncbi:MAG: hypothetical protein P1P77_05145, partial [Spirochaetaceae bacterium]|nr:hypothetical protein [Spirochaetaceae bacterium]
MRKFLRLGLMAALILCSLSVYAAESWYRKIDIDAYERLVGLSPMTPAEAAVSNAYRFSYDAAGRLVEVVYRRSGRSLSDPRFGVPRIEISYESVGYIHRRYTDERGVPVADERGVWSRRVRLDESGHAVGVFHYDRFGNIIADKDGVALRLWESDKAGRKSRERFFDVSGARISDTRSVSEVRYQWTPNDDMAGMRYYDLDSRPVSAMGEGVHGYEWAYDESGLPSKELRFDDSGKPVVAADGSAAVEWTRDTRGLPMEERRLGSDGSLLADADGVAIYRRNYDEAGNLVRESHF